MSNNYSKRLSTEQITQKLEQLHYHFNEQYWNDFQQNHQTVSRISPAAIQAKFNPKFLAIPVGLLVIASIVYFSINNMRSQNVAKAPVIANEVVDQKGIEPVTPTVVKSETVKSEKELPALTPTATEAKKEEVVTKPEPIKQEVIKEEVKNPEPTNSIVTSEVARTKKEVTETRTTKKKKKRRNTESTNNAFVPTAGEDDVVIPE